jgi:hypothetical protein
MLRRATVPGHDEQAAHHEQLAEAIDREERDMAKLRTSKPPGQSD